MWENLTTVLVFIVGIGITLSCMGLVVFWFAKKFLKEAIK